MNAAVSVTSAAVRVPGASTLTELWALLERAGCAGKVDFFAGLPFREEVAVARVDDGASPSSGSRTADRSVVLGLSCVADALADHPRFGGLPAERRAVVVGTAFGPMGALIEHAQAVAADGLKTISPRTVPGLMANGLAAEIALRHQCRGPSHTVFTACASGTDAVGCAWGILQSDAADLVVVCGSDAPLRADVLAGFQRLGALSAEVGDPSRACRPFDAHRGGFMMGEGASCLVLERGLHADRLGTLLGYAATSDAHHVVAPAPDGRGAEEAMRLALRSARLDAGDLAHVNAHGTGTSLNDRAEASAICRLVADTTPIWSVKGSLGHLMGAAGTTEAIASLLSLHAGYLPATAGLEDLDPTLPAIDVSHGAGRATSKEHAISSSFAFGGHNAVVVLGR